MSTEKRRRGRPRGSGKNDSPYLAQVADLLIRDPALKPTTAMKRVMSGAPTGHAPEATLRRWQIKWKKHAAAELAAARERACPEPPTQVDHARGHAGPLVDLSDLACTSALDRLQRQLSDPTYMSAFDRLQRQLFDPSYMSAFDRLQRQLSDPNFMGAFDRLQRQLFDPSYMSSFDRLQRQLSDPNFMSTFDRLQKRLSLAYARVP